MHAQVLPNQILRYREAREVAALLQKKHVKVVGLDKSGKTTLLHALAEELRNKTPILDNLSGDLDTRPLAHLSRANILLIDDTITFCNYVRSGGDRILYINQIKRLIANGARVVFALLKAQNVEGVFNGHFPGTEKYLLNAQLTLEDAAELVRRIDVNGTTVTLNDEAVAKFLEISGRSFYFIDKVLTAYRDYLKSAGVYSVESDIKLHASDVEERVLIPSIVRVPCHWIYRLKQSEIALLKLILANQSFDLSAHADAIKELSGLGVIESAGERLIIPGSAVRANFERTIMLMKNAV